MRFGGGFRQYGYDGIGGILLADIEGFADAVLGAEELAGLGCGEDGLIGCKAMCRDGACGGLVGKDLEERGIDIIGFIAGEGAVVETGADVQVAAPVDGGGVLNVFASCHD